MSAEERQKADVWHAEGRMAALEELRTQLAAAEGMSVRLAAAEGTVEALRASTEAEVKQRLAKEIDGVRKDFEIANMKELSVLKEQLAGFDGQSTFIAMITDGHAAMKEKIAGLEEQRELLQIQLLEATQAKTKSSHVIGKQGEALVLELLEETVIPAFPYSTVTDMTAVSHAADFHLSVMTARGTRTKILIDSKKYKQAVNSSEISKLNADVDADDEAHCGMMISLDSAISSTKQFQVKFTNKKKPVIYLSFQDMPTELRKEVICWAIHSLLAVVGEVDQSTRNTMLENIEHFLAEINSSVRDIDNVIRSHVKLLDNTRQIKSSIIQKIASYRDTNSDNIDIIDGEEEGSDSNLDGCAAVLKSTGRRCGKSVYMSTQKCKHHTSRKDKGAD